MQVGTHRIRRQRWQVKVTSSATAFALRQTLRTQLDTVLLPAFQRAFDALNTGDEVWHIPRLTLDLHLSDGDDLVAALAQLIEQELAKALPREMGANPSRGAARRLAPQASRRRLLLDYLSTGRIAWHAARQETPELLSLLRDAAHAFATEPHQIVGALGEPLEARVASSFRLLQLLDPLPRAALLQQVADDNSPGAQSLHRFIAVPQLGSGLKLRLAALLLVLRAEDLRLPLAAAVVELLRECETELIHAGITDIEFRTALDALRGQSPLGGEAWTKHLSTPLAPLGRGARGEGQLLSSVPLQSPLTPNPSPQGGEGNKREEDSNRHTPQISASGTERPPRGDRTAREDTNLATDAPTNTAATSDRDELVLAMQAAVAMRGNEQLAEAADGVLANDAGLILLHPFLTRLFQHVGLASDSLLNEDVEHVSNVLHPEEHGHAGSVPHVSPQAAKRTRRLDPVQMPRAAALLHWLASGREEAFEFELSLIKVLLGLTPHDPLPVAGGLLSDDDRAEADALLAAAIDHWAALRNTSISGLRSSFLQRRGLLYDGEQGWRLQVETEPFDMLLGQLPWGINVVTLPWMTRPIFTDWPTP